MQNYCQAALWAIIASRLFAPSYTTQEEILLVTLIFLKNSLTRWYHSPAGQNASRIPDMSTKVVGTTDDPKFKAKAAETHGVLLWLVDFLDEHKTRCDTFPQFLEAGLMMKRYVAIIKESTPGVNMSLAQRQDSAGIWFTCVNR